MQKDYTSYAFVYLCIFVCAYTLIYSPYVECIFPLGTQSNLSQLCQSGLLKEQGLARFSKEPFEKRMT